jgi:hypothetical protein
LQLFQRRNAADMIEMRVREGDRLYLEIVSLECLDDPFRLVARIDADGFFGGFTANNAGVLLERGDSDFFYNHRF